ncbi:hypothetical protein Y032_0005g2551 [Ancylostoma ceylanicum]|uniref:Uncharacterized protein n=1 Tax=Ancylostoma ceylanicum TaxID=53326 RepID=A0A016VSI1_9BILA|nr:hypothetical protein Y032_0005g2551 [Ancylostoma ceylanicum]
MDERKESILDRKKEIQSALPGCPPSKRPTQNLAMITSEKSAINMAITVLISAGILKAGAYLIFVVEVIAVSASTRHTEPSGVHKLSQNGLKPVFRMEPVPVYTRIDV